MKKALFALAAVAMASSAFADGTITFQNRNNTTTDGLALYNTPIWQEFGLGVAGKEAGLLAGGVTVGLFFNGTQTLTSGGAPVQTTLRTDTTNAKFFGGTPSQGAVIPGVLGGTTQTLEVRAWQGASFAAASSGGGQFNSWTFTSAKLGGIDAGGGIVPTPNMTGWGPDNGAGLALRTVPEPTTIAFGALGIGALLLRRRK